jgi:hypothetical protein
MLSRLFGNYRWRKEAKYGETKPGNITIFLLRDSTRGRVSMGCQSYEMLYELVRTVGRDNQRN